MSIEELDPQVQLVIQKTIDAGIPKVHTLDPTEARKLIENLAEARKETYPPPEVLSVEDTATGADYGRVPVRIYRASDEVGPVMVFYHGGGHVFGSINTHDTMARFLCRTCGITVVSAEYRMGPEDPFPSAVEDAYQTARWAANHASDLKVDPARLVVGGDSAGGNLAAVTALMARDTGAFPIAAQLLVYPVTDYRGSTASHRSFAEGYGILEAETMVWFRDHYLGGMEGASDWRASPLLVESVAGLPPAFVLTASHDVLRDEGIAYADRLREAGATVKHVDYPGMIHGFFGYLGLVDMAERAHKDVAEWLQTIWV
ncbi:MAG: alpha/beta hydrolase [Pseudomonadota bacterium]